MATQCDQAANGLKKIKEYVKFGVDTVPDFTAEYLDITDSDGSPNNQESRNITENYQSIMKHYIEMDRDIYAFIKALTDIKASVCDTMTVEELLAKLEDLHRNNLSNQAPVESHDSYKELARLISSKGGRPSDDIDMEEEDLVIQEESQSIKCPYTGKDMVEPVKNSNCGHSYDKEGIMAYVKLRGRHAKCPVSGCINPSPITKDCLKPDKKLKKEIEKRKRESQR